ncbi:MAG: hypothetical protein WC632_04110 [Candidatus Margulisiibacteriota bacterium]
MAQKDQTLKQVKDNIADAKKSLAKAELQLKKVEQLSKPGPQKAVNF